MWSTIVALLGAMFNLLLDISVYMVVDALYAKRAIPKAKTNEEKNVIWQRMSLALLTVSLIVWQIHHTPYILWSCIGFTYAFSCRGWLRARLTADRAYTTADWAMNVIGACTAIGMCCVDVVVRLSTKLLHYANQFRLLYVEKRAAPQRGTSDPSPPVQRGGVSDLHKIRARPSTVKSILRSKPSATECSTQNTTSEALNVSPTEFMDTDNTANVTPIYGRSPDAVLRHRNHTPTSSQNTPHNNTSMASPNSWHLNSALKTSTPTDSQATRHACFTAQDTITQYYDEFMQEVTQENLAAV